MFITAEQMKSAIRPFEPIRKAVGNRVETMVEPHSLQSLPVAEDIARALEPCAPRRLEDPDPNERRSGAGRVRPLDRR